MLIVSVWRFNTTTKFFKNYKKEWTRTLANEKYYIYWKNTTCVIFFLWNSQSHVTLKMNQRRESEDFLSHLGRCDNNVPICYTISNLEHCRHFNKDGDCVPALLRLLWLYLVRWPTSLQKKIICTTQTLQHLHSVQRHWLEQQPTKSVRSCSMCRKIHAHNWTLGKPPSSRGETKTSSCILSSASII